MKRSGNHFWLPFKGKQKEWGSLSDSHETILGLRSGLRTIIYCNQPQLEEPWMTVNHALITWQMKRSGLPFKRKTKKMRESVRQP